MNTWYAAQDLMRYIGHRHKVFYCPLNDNRQVDDSAGWQSYERVDSLHWTADELAQANCKTLTAGSISAAASESKRSAQNLR